nr:hypothetical protein [Candidatus Sigynarchaeota archaeon]
MENVITINERSMKCPSCNGNLVLARSGYTCSSCGVVHGVEYADDDYFETPNERYHVKSSKQFIAPGKQLDTVSTLGSFIDFYKLGFFFDNKHHALTPDKQVLFYRLKFTQDYLSRLDRQDTRYRIVKIARIIGDALDLLPDARRRALYLYAKVVSSTRKEGCKIPNHVSLIATALYIASREYSSRAPVTVQEICSTFRARGHRVHCKMILRDLPAFKRYCGLKYAVHGSKVYLERLMNTLSIDPVFLDRFRCRRGMQEVPQFINT